MLATYLDLIHMNIVGHSVGRRNVRSASCLRSRASLIGCMFWAGAGMGQQAGIRPNATSVLRNHCSVWDGEIQERAIEVEGESDSVYAIDV